jgi:undecaprenyl-diphosphatase
VDALVFRFINNMAEKNEIVDETMKLISSYAIYVLIASFIIALIFKSFRTYGVLGFFSTAVGMIINMIIANIIYRDRPFVTYDDVHLLLEKGVSASFPSDQATVAFVWAFVIISYNRKIGVVCLIIALLVGISRIYVGHHYPFDILGGMIIALLSTQFIKWVITSRSLRKNQNKTSLKA